MSPSRWRPLRLRRPPWGWWLLTAGGLAVLTGLVPAPAAAHAWELGWPVLLFLILVKPVADLCQVAGLFRVAADALARLARGSGSRLFWLFTGLATGTTVFLSLDTTAVLLAPIGVVLARRLRLDPLPYAFAAIWLANSASLLLPVSNLTNLTAHQRLGSAYLSLSWLPQLGVLAVTLLVLGLRWGRRVAGAYEPPPVEPVGDRVLLVAAAAVAVALGPLLVLGVPAWLVAAGGLAVLWGTAALRQHPEARLRPLLALFPLQVAAGVLGLFWLVAGFSDRLAGWLPTPATGISGNLLIAGIAALAANAVNNLPAFLALEAWAGTPQQVLALLVGVNVGPTILLWGSLANLLWWQSIRRLGVLVGVRRFAAEGLLLVPVAVLVGAVLVGV